MTKQLLLLRHAKSSWDHPGLSDHERPLNARGRRDAARMGEHLRGRAISPELVLCSSAVRTRETLAGLALGPSVEVVVDPTLYGASSGELHARVRVVDDAVGVLMLIAHNPGTHALATTLVDDPLRIPAYPTAALTDLVAPIDSWAELRPGVARLEEFVTPKTLD